MNKTEQGKTVYCSFPGLFTNSQSLVIEYHDVIRATWFGLLTTMVNYGAMKELFDVSNLSSLNDIELFEWYIHRRHQNFFMDIDCIPPFPSEEEYLKFMNSISYDSLRLENLYRFPFVLNAQEILRGFLSMYSDLIKHIYIYEGSDPRQNIHLEKEMQENVPGKEYTFLYGDFGECIRGINRDATYMISDITKLQTIADMGRLECASVLIADGYRYNYMEDDSTKLKVDIEQLQRNIPCKISFFNNLYQEQPKNPDYMRNYLVTK